MKTPYDASSANDPANLTRKEHRRAIARVHYKGGFFSVERIYVFSGLMTLTEAAFLSDLENHFEQRHEQCDEDDYFLCTTEYLRRSLGWTEDEQRSYFRRLKKKGYLKTKTKGMPRRRWVFVDFEKIRDDMITFEATQSVHFDTLQSVHFDTLQSVHFDTDCSVSKCTRNKSTSKEQRKNNPSPQAATEGLKGTSSRQKTTDLNGFHDNKETNAHTFAMTLYRTLAKKTKIMRHVKNMNVWVKEFAGLLTVVEDDDVREVLDWYVANLDGEYVPDARSASTFRDKFPQIQAAMRRQRKKDPPVRLYKVIEVDNGNGTVTSRELYKVVPKSEKDDHPGWRYSRDENGDDV